MCICVCAPLPQFGGSVASVHPFLGLHNSYNAHCRRGLCVCRDVRQARLISVPGALLSRQCGEKERGREKVGSAGRWGMCLSVCLENCICMSALHLHFIKFQKPFAQSRPPTCQFTWAPLSAQGEQGKMRKGGREETGPRGRWGCAHCIFMHLITHFSMLKCNSSFVTAHTKYAHTHTQTHMQDACMHMRCREGEGAGEM